MDELKPCPFCGVKDLHIRKLPYKLCGKEMWNCRCENCYAMTGIQYSKKMAIEAWNRRYTPEEIDFDYGAED